MLDLPGEPEFFSRSILETMTANKYLGKFGKILIAGKGKILSLCRIGGEYFSSIAVIGEKIYSNYLKNMNHVHKDSKYLMSVKITLGTNIIGGDTLFYGGVKRTDLWEKLMS